MRLDLIDEFRLDLHPYVAGEWYPIARRRRQVLPARLVSSSELRDRTVGLHALQHR